MEITNAYSSNIWVRSGIEKMIEHFAIFIQVVFLSYEADI